MNLSAGGQTGQGFRVQKESRGGERGPGPGNASRGTAEAGISIFAVSTFDTDYNCSPTCADQNIIITAGNLTGTMELTGVNDFTDDATETSAFSRAISRT